MKQRGSLICFTGIDGSGKTTQAKLAVAWLTSRGVKSTYTWSRGEVLAIRKFFLFIGRRALGTSTREINGNRTSYREYQIRKSKLMGNSLVRTLWTVIAYVEHLVQINRDIRGRIQDGYCVVCDRYQWDSLIDLAVLNNKDSNWLVGGFNRFMWKLIPKPSITFFIDIPPEEAMKRKDDIPSLDYIQKRASHYRYLATYDLMIEIDGNQEISVIQKEIISKIEFYLERQGRV